MNGLTSRVTLSTIFPVAVTEYRDKMQLWRERVHFNSQRVAWHGSGSVRLAARQEAG